jgi:hypothetical protein
MTASFTDRQLISILYELAGAPPIAMGPDAGRVTVNPATLVFAADRLRALTESQPTRDPTDAFDGGRLG